MAAINSEKVGVMLTAEQQVRLTIGDLVVQNAALKEMVENLTKENADLKAEAVKSADVPEPKRAKR